MHQQGHKHTFNLNSCIYQPNIYNVHIFFYNIIGDIMKKYFYMLLSIIFLLGIIVYLDNKKEKEEIKNVVEIKENIDKEEIKEPEYIDNNPIIVGLYKNYRDGSNRKLIKEYSSKWEYHKDISSFEVYYTNEEEITNKNQIKTFDLYKDNYEDIDNYRIGYIIEFETIDNKYNKTIIRPKDSEEFYDYLEIYLYDDYHRTGGWYRHTEDNEWNENTLLTSIKLTAGKKVNEISSDILVTAFTYDNDDFDLDNNYIGISKYQIIIKNNK